MNTAKDTSPNFSVISFERLRITEIFLSIQGESTSSGWPTVFVRLTGCPLRCNYCDSEYAFYGGAWRTISSIVDEVTSYATRRVCVTGGEPLAQKRCLILLQRLCDADFEVSLETSGALEVSQVDPRVSKVLDLKAPGSGEVNRNLWSNIDYLTSHDQIKFVLSDRNDYDWARSIVDRYQLSQRCEVLFSPVYGRIVPRELAEWILADRLPVRFQLQLHKVLWGEEPGR